MSKYICETSFLINIMLFFCNELSYYKDPMFWDKIIVHPMPMHVLSSSQLISIIISDMQCCDQIAPDCTFQFYRAELAQLAA